MLVTETELLFVIHFVVFASSIHKYSLTSPNDLHCVTVDLECVTSSAVGDVITFVPYKS